MATANAPDYPQIAGLPLRTPAWDADEWHDLYGDGGLRGGDDVIPGADGETHRTKVRGALRALVRMRVWGTHDSDGIEQADVWAGLHANLDELRAAIEGPGLKTVEVIHDDTVVLTGDGELVGPWRPQITKTQYADLVLDLKIPAGRLEAPPP